MVFGVFGTQPAAFCWAFLTVPFKTIFSHLGSSRAVEGSHGTKTEIAGCEVQSPAGCGGDGPGFVFGQNFNAEDEQIEMVRMKYASLVLNEPL